MAPRPIIPALAVALVLALSACGGNGPGRTTDVEPELAAASDLPSFAVGPTGIADDVTVADCGTDPGQVTASGTATNSGRFGRDLVIVVSWAAAGTSDVLASATTQLEDVPPGESRDWQVTAELAGRASTTCIPASYAGQLG